MASYDTKYQNMPSRNKGITKDIRHGVFCSIELHMESVYAVPQPVELDTDRWRVVTPEPAQNNHDLT